MSAGHRADLRVLHVADLAFGGGAEWVFRQTIQEGAQRGMRVDALVSDGRRTPVSYVFSLKCYQRVRRRLRRFDPDLVHLHNYYHFLSPSVLLAIRHHRRDHPRLRVVFTAHDYHLVCPNSGFQHFPHGVRTTFDKYHPRVPLVARFDSRSTLHSALKAVQHALSYRVLDLRDQIDLILTPSDILGEIIHRSGVTTPTVTVRNPVPPMPDDGEVRAPRDLVYIGRLAPEKGITELIIELGLAGQPRTLDLYGAGPAESQIRAAARVSSPAKVTLHGPLAREDVFGVLSSARAFVLPSLWPENAPIAVVEAATAGLPVLVSGGWGAEELARKSRRWATYRLGDQASFRDGLAHVSETGPPNSMLDPEEFTAEHYADMISDSYDRAMKGARP